MKESFVNHVMFGVTEFYPSMFFVGGWICCTYLCLQIEGVMQEEKQQVAV